MIYEYDILPISDIIGNEIDNASATKADRVCCEHAAPVDTICRGC